MANYVDSGQPKFTLNGKQYETLDKNDGSGKIYGIQQDGNSEVLKDSGAGQYTNGKTFDTDALSALDSSSTTKVDVKLPGNGDTIVLAKDPDTTNHPNTYYSYDPDSKQVATWTFTSDGQTNTDTGSFSTDDSNYSRVNIEGTSSGGISTTSTVTETGKTPGSVADHSNTFTIDGQNGSYTDDGDGLLKSDGTGAQYTHTAGTNIWHGSDGSTLTSAQVSNYETNGGATIRLPDGDMVTGVDGDTATTSSGVTTHDYTTTYFDENGKAQFTAHYGSDATRTTATSVTTDTGATETPPTKDQFNAIHTHTYVMPDGSRVDPVLGTNNNVSQYQVTSSDGSYQQTYGVSGDTLSITSISQTDADSAQQQALEDSKTITITEHDTTYVQKHPSSHDVGSAAAIGSIGLLGASAISGLLGYWFCKEGIYRRCT